jgi:hypothetical protein
MCVIKHTQISMNTGVWKRFLYFATKELYQLSPLHMQLSCANNYRKDKRILDAVIINVTTTASTNVAIVGYGRISKTHIAI